MGTKQDVLDAIIQGNAILAEKLSRIAELVIQLRDNPAQTSAEFDEIVAAIQDSKNSLEAQEDTILG